MLKGHFITSSVDVWLKQYSASPPRVLIEDEANYEQLRYATMLTNVPSWLARQSAWQSQVAGAAGFTYGGQGIWWACYSRGYINGNCGPNDAPGTPRNASGYYTWDQGLGFEVGGHQLPAMAAFWRNIPWHTLAPDAAAIVWDPAAPPGTQKPFQKADALNDYVVAYLPQANGNPHAPEGPPGTPGIGCRPPAHPPNNTNCTGCYGGTLTVNTNTNHALWWFNPRSGASTQIGATLAAGSGSIRIPATRPGGAAEAYLDWVLLLKPVAATTPARARPLAAAAAAAAADKSWVTALALTRGARTRLDESEVGCEFTATEAAATVTRLCRYPTPGSRNVVKVQLADATSGALVAWANVDALSAARDGNGFVCAAAVLTRAGGVLVQGSKYVLSELNVGCDSYYDDVGVTIAVRNPGVAAVKSVYGKPPNVSPGGGGANHSYGPLNFYFK